MVDSKPVPRYPYPSPTSSPIETADIKSSRKSQNEKRSDEAQQTIKGEGQKRKNLMC